MFPCPYKVLWRHWDLDPLMWAHLLWFAWMLFEFLSHRVYVQKDQLLCGCTEMVQIWKLYLVRIISHGTLPWKKFNAGLVGEDKLLRTGYYKGILTDLVRFLLLWQIPSVSVQCLELQRAWQLHVPGSVTYGTPTTSLGIRQAPLHTCCCPGQFSYDPSTSNILSHPVQLSCTFTSSPS